MDTDTAIAVIEALFIFGVIPLTVILVIAVGIHSSRGGN